MTDHSYTHHYTGHHGWSHYDPQAVHHAGPIDMQPLQAEARDLRDYHISTPLMAEYPKDIYRPPEHQDEHKQQPKLHDYLMPEND